MEADMSAVKSLQTKTMMALRGPQREVCTLSHGIKGLAEGASSQAFLICTHTELSNFASWCPGFLRLWSFIYDLITGTSAV